MRPQAGRLVPDAIHVESIQAYLPWHLLPLAPAVSGTYTVGDYRRRNRIGITMDANELRGLQAPLKTQYREQPETARIADRGAPAAAATLELRDVASRLPSWGGETKAGLHPATGGDGSLACSAGSRRWSRVPA